jgi:ornithine cyclodeaminase/alanine dehydrogenase-like protein (mu-crystallin family)
MTGQAEGGVLFLTGDEVARALPPVEQRLELAAHAMRALVADAELPPKVGVHPRQSASFAHAMPAFVRGPSSDGSGDLLGLKWVSGFPDNAARGMPPIAATVLLSDPTTGRVSAVLDGGGLTAHRTAAVSGVAIRAWLEARTGSDDVDAGLSGQRVAIVGAGAQALSHLPVLALLLPGSHLVVADRHFDRTERVMNAAQETGAFSLVDRSLDAAEAVDGADVVLTMIAFGPERQIIPASAFESAKLIVAVDYDMCVPAAVARNAALGSRFIVDERGQFLANRSSAVFDGYPDPALTLGELLLMPDDAAATPMPDWASGTPVLVTHLGVGVADLVFADAVVRAAEAQGLGTRVGGGPS